MLKYRLTGTSKAVVRAQKWRRRTNDISSSGRANYGQNFSVGEQIFDITGTVVTPAGILQLFEKLTIL